MLAGSVWLAAVGHTDVSIHAHTQGPLTLHTSWAHVSHIILIDQGIMLIICNQ